MRTRRQRIGAISGAAFLAGALVLVAGGIRASAQEVSGASETVRTAPATGIRDRARFRAQRTNIRNFGKPDEVRIFEGNAVFEVPYGEMTVTFKADTIAFEWAKEIITATGNVVIEDGTNAVRAHAMKYAAPARKARFVGAPEERMGVTLNQSLGEGETNSYQTDWLLVTFGPEGLEEIETGQGEGQFYLTGEEPLPITPSAAGISPATDEPAIAPRKVSPPLTGN